jgi:hypothetical protein
MMVKDGKMNPYKTLWGKIMPYDNVSKLWADNDGPFFIDKQIVPQKQSGPHCVSNVLAMLSGKTPEYFQKVVNTQDPLSWSDSLRPFEMKLAYCSHDIRKIKFYIDELKSYNDLFLLCYYSKSCSIEEIMGDPDEKGWVCGSHVVILHKDHIIDSKRGDSIDAREHDCMQAHTKRIFRIVPVAHRRGI